LNILKRLDVFRFYAGIIIQAPVEDGVFAGPSKDLFEFAELQLFDFFGAGAFPEPDSSKFV